jgi:hypothetical protein
MWTSVSPWLRDRDFGVAFEGFEMSEISNGSVVEVRDAVLEGEAEAAAAEARSLQARPNTSYLFSSAYAPFLRNEVGTEIT